MSETRAAAERLTGTRLIELGAKKYRGEVAAYTIGLSHATLFLVEGYPAESGFWSMLVKYPIKGSLEYYASRHPHFERRIRTEADLRALCDGIGLSLEPKGRMRASKEAT